MTGTLSVLDHTGDTRIEWDSEDPASVEIARASFNVARRKGHFAYRLTSGDRRGEQIREFDPEAERIVLSPQLVGG